MLGSAVELSEQMPLVLLMHSLLTLSSVVGML